MQCEGIIQNLKKQSTREKLLQCSISECKMKAVQSIRVGFKEKRNLCEKHYRIFLNKEEKYKVKFTRGTELK